MICGMAGFIGNYQEALDRFEEMVKAKYHRDPDDHSIGFASSARLSILDLRRINRYMMVQIGDLCAE